MVPASPGPYLAIACMLGSTAFLAGTTLLAKLLGTDTLGAPLHPFQVTFGRFAFAWMVLLLALPVLRRHLAGRPSLPLHLGRTVCGAIGVTLMFAAVARLPLADATAISFLNPVFCMLLAMPLLGERVGPWRWLAAGVALFGALILLRPGPATFQPAAFLALGAALVMGVELIFIKKLTGREPPYQILLINNTIGLVLLSLAVLFVWSPPNPPQWAAMAGIGVLMACAQMLFLNAMRRADASFVTVFSYATLVFAALYDAVIFSTLPDAISVLGAATILSGGLLLAWREGRDRRRQG